MNTAKAAHKKHSTPHAHPGEILCAKVATPLGTLLLYSDEKGLVALDFPGAKIAAGSSAASPKDRESLRAAESALRDYFAKNKALPRTLKSALEGTDFQRKVWAAIEKIPLGKTKTYGELAEQIGHPGASRAVGAACGANPLPLFVPCHRVLAANGKIGGFSGGLGVKKLLLRMEGVEFKE
jgi:methylated-DNA-[protein]-cysteine S-methyltransferase